MAVNIALLVAVLLVFWSILGTMIAKQCVCKPKNWAQTVWAMVILGPPGWFVFAIASVICAIGYVVDLETRVINLITKEKE
jgi:hypothetical protein